MAADEAAARFEGLAEGLVAPLVLGGKIQLARPFGRLALTVGQGQRMRDADLRSRLEVARVRRARLIAPVDVLPDFSVVDWAIAAALNDLLQVTNHELSGAFMQGRHVKLLASVRDVCRLLPRPRDVGEALARHATFGRVMELGRTDTTVQWWTGSAHFRGQPPSPRLLRWRGLRRVQVETSRVDLASMSEGMTPLVVSGFVETLGLWLACSPLTDIASITRAAPAFAWSPAALALLTVAPGRALAFRLLARQPFVHVRAALVEAERTLAPALEAYKPVVEAFSRETIEGIDVLREDQGPGRRGRIAPRSPSST
jgi:hypothetical protein